MAVHLTVIHILDVAHGNFLGAAHLFLKLPNHTIPNTDQFSQLLVSGI